jgi:WD40 repeat protein
VRIWDVVAPAPVGAPLAGHYGAVHAVAIGWAGDRGVVVSGSWDQTVRVWDAITGDALAAPLAGHDGAVRGGHWAGSGSVTSSSPALGIGRCGSGTRSPATQSASS